MDDPLHSIIYGPSTTNKIERWWRDLHERLERYFKAQLTRLLRGREYDPHNLTERQLLAYVYLPILQRECDIFISYWNSHKIRNQDNLEIPTGVPDHMFNFPEQYGGKNMGIPLMIDQLQDVAEVFGVIFVDKFDYMEGSIARQCSQYLPHVETVECKNAIDAYRFIKSKVVS